MRFMKYLSALALLLGLMLSLGSSPALAMGNPATANCVKQGGTSFTRNTPQGQAGFCKLRNGTVCDEWALFRGQCPAKAAAPNNIGMANPASTHCIKKGGKLQSQGSVSYCALPNGMRCEQWAFFRGQCPKKAVSPSKIGMANPASVNCVKKGGKLSGDMCVFPNGRQCGQWQFFRGECTPTGPILGRR